MPNRIWDIWVAKDMTRHIKKIKRIEGLNNLPFGPIHRFITTQTDGDGESHRCHDRGTLRQNQFSWFQISSGDHVATQSWGRAYLRGDWIGIRGFTISLARIVSCNLWRARPKRKLRYFLNLLCLKRSECFKYYGLDLKLLFSVQRIWKWYVYEKLSILKYFWGPLGREKHDAPTINSSIPGHPVFENTAFCVYRPSARNYFQIFVSELALSDTL